MNNLPEHVRTAAAESISHAILDLEKVRSLPCSIIPESEVHYLHDAAQLLRDVYRQLQTPTLTGRIVRADNLVKLLGLDLVGRRIHTNPLGDYPGGTATVTEVLPDSGAPDIVFRVRLEGWGEIGVFEYEPVMLLPPLHPPQGK